uniref:VWA7 N-terminal domain-containing protein n=1 Tax=candidate division WOR-3 bacterium TaxID=2052148 RepID=A0A7C4YDP1_UNCW3
MRIHIGPIEIGSSSPSHFERRKVSRGNKDYHLNVFYAGRKFIKTSVNSIYLKMEKFIITPENLSNNREALYYLGLTLHSLQDFFSHSNFIDLKDDDKKKVIEALFNDIEAPDGLKIAYVGPLFFLDDFPHGAFGFGNNKDNPRWTREGIDKFEDVKNVAIYWTRKLVEKLMKRELFKNSNHPK